MQVGRRRSSSGGYNPLNDKDVKWTGLESWICTSEMNVQYCSAPQIDLKVPKWCKSGCQVKAVKEGDYLKETDTGLYLPLTGPDKVRLFKNVRALLTERVSRTESHDSDSQDELTTKPSDFSIGSSSSRISRRSSFRFVDAEGISHRIAGDSDLIVDVKVRPEVWLCCSKDSVSYLYEPSLEAASTSAKKCQPGAKVTAVREKDFLHVYEVKNSFDVMGAAEMIGRRSLKSQGRVTVHDTNLYLPFKYKNERLFKNEKLAMLEMSKENAGPLSPSSAVSTPTTQRDSCAVM